MRTPGIGLGALLAIGCANSSRSPEVRFVSVPDFVNMDLQYRDPRLFDLTVARQLELGAEIESGGPQAAINPHVGDFVGTVEQGYRGASQVLLEALHAERADFFTVSGDMLYTRWPKTEQLAQGGADAHIRAEADVYYDGWIDSVRDFSGYDHANQQVFTVVGDHEVGDNNWPAEKRALLDVYREVYVAKLGNPSTSREGAYADAPSGMEGRVFAVQRGNLLLVGIDQFAVLDQRRGPIDVHGAQLEWLASTLTRAADDRSIDHIVVLGHAPIARQSEVRIGLSSGLMNDTDEAGELWQLFVRYGVALYLPGEVHAVSVQEAEGVVQVVTGTNLFQPTGADSFVGDEPFDLSGGLASEENYLLIESFGNRLELTLKQIETRIWGFRGTDLDPVNDEPYKDREARVSMEASEVGFVEVGTLTLRTTSAGTSIEEASGLLR
ncbi:MAG: hypothetical protein EP330_26230 [Deltaproteobacteria bacterium]|nr:MAG: hypothetical protein EP330_26230 [Deltaproteobacteria bacterium]